MFNSNHFSVVYFFVVFLLCVYMYIHYDDYYCLFLNYCYVYFIIFYCFMFIVYVYVCRHKYIFCFAFICVHVFF